MFTTMLILRILQFLLSLIVLALSAATINKTFYGHEGVDGYSIFCSLFTWLSIIYFVIPKLHTEKFNDSLVVLGLEILNNVLWFTNFIALAAIRGPGSCSSFYFTFDNRIVSYSNSACKTGKASIAFAALTWCSFIATTYILVRARMTSSSEPETQTENMGIHAGDLEVANLSLTTVDTNHTAINSTMSESEKVYVPTQNSSLQTHEFCKSA